MATIIAYKGMICIDGMGEDGLSPAALNNPSEEGQIGMIVDADKCYISQEAIDLLKSMPIVQHPFGDVGCTEEDGLLKFAWIGGLRRIIDPEEASAASDSNFDLLTATAHIEISNDFKEAIDNPL